MKSLSQIQGLGTYWWFEFFDENLDLPQLEARIQKEIITFQTRYSRFTEDSWLSQLNRERYFRSPDPEFLQLIQLGARYHVKTFGYFHPVVGHVLKELGYDAEYTFKSSDQQGVIPNLYNFVSLLPEEIRLNGYGDWDMGGYGKGFLIDKLGKILESDFGLKNFLINGGGDILVRGSQEQELILEDPFQPGYEIGRVKLKNQALAASSTEKRKWRDTQKGQIYNHLLNPRTNQVADKSASFVVASTALEADIVATVACLTVDKPEVLKLLKKEIQFQEWVKTS